MTKYIKENLRPKGRADKSSFFALIIAAAAALLLLISVIAVIIMNNSEENAKYACIYLNGELIRAIALTDEAETSFTVTGANGAYNTIKVKNGTIGVTEASCPDKLCERAGFTASTLMPIVCLPNHLVIELVSELKEDVPDGIVY